MKLSYQWLCDYVDVRDIAPEVLAERLTSVGLAVDGVAPRCPEISGVVVGEVVTCEAHPNADRLHVCTVNVGGAELLQIVCGAKNVHASMRVPVATIGAHLPGGKISRAKLRGVESFGMLCSAKELGLEVQLLQKEQTEGLFVLPEDAPLGTDIVQYLHLDDVIFDIDLTPNRSDCLSLRGMAYEVAAIYNRPLKFPSVMPGAAAQAVRNRSADPSTKTSTSPISVRIDTDFCTEYSAQVLTDLEVAPSPMWMQMRLLTAGVRPINNIVDITNYIMLEWGQPLHAFDFECVHNQSIIVRQGEAGEALRTLDGALRELTTDTMVIADTEGPIAIAGVMGGENSEVTGATSQIILESAAFHAASVRRTGQRFALHSEAQQRFEKGIDETVVVQALERASELLEQIAHATRVGGVVSEQCGTASNQGVVVDFSALRCNQLLGTNISADEMADIFTRLGLSLDARNHERWQVGIPSRRRDLQLEADLVEEVGRMHGLDNIPATLPLTTVTTGVRTPSQKLRKRTREVLLGIGMTEVFTYTFAHPTDIDALRVDDDSMYRKMVPLLRPISEERVAMRTHMLPGLCRVATYNLTHGVEGGQIFEIGRVYWPKQLPLSEPPIEQTQWAGLWFGNRDVEFGHKADTYDFYDVKGEVEAWVEAMGFVDDVEYRPAQTPWLHPGRSAEVLHNGELIGSFGELHPETAQKLGLTSAFYAEFNLDLLTKFVTERWRVTPLPKFPAARRDLAVIVEKSVTAKQLLEVAKACDARSAEPILESCEVFDVYAGKGIPDLHKSVAVALVYRSADKTLTDDEIAAAQIRILNEWQDKLGANPRTM